MRLQFILVMLLSLFVSAHAGEESQAERGLVAASVFCSTELHRAIKKGNFAGARALLLQDPSLIDRQNKKGNTPLALAAYSPDYGSIAFVEELVALKAKVNLQNKEGDAPLHNAMYSSHAPQVVQHLLSARGLDVNLKNNMGNTPVHEAVKSIWAVFIIDLLLARNDADWEAKNKEGNTPLHEAVCAELWAKSVVPKLISVCKLDVNSQNIKGDTPLHFAARFRDESVVNDLIELGAAVNIPNNDGDMPLHCAARRYDGAPVVESLLEHRADLTVRNRKGELFANLTQYKEKRQYGGSGRSLCFVPSWML